ncbi:COG1361 family protein [Paraburkholderia oxyphila]|uniref:hypothetical protein n=1 Tax=Paraburkholderia oxyphila TaxID=614212 RepID=UPI0012EDB59C|nr:hypothetical protein [Paraburkholderia oxyphila]
MPENLPQSDANNKQQEPGVVSGNMKIESQEIRLANRFKKFLKSTIAYWGSFVALVAAAGTAWQAYIAKESLNETRQTFRIDERAWLEIKVGDPEAQPPSPGFPRVFRYEISVQNFGKTVAHSVEVKMSNPSGSFQFVENPQYTAGMQAMVESGNNGQTKWTPGSIAPNAAPTLPLLSAGSAPQKTNSSDTEYSFIVGRVDYLDAFNTRHWLRFCYFVSNDNGELRYCKSGNDEDSNPEPNQ